MVSHILGIYPQLHNITQVNLINPLSHKGKVLKPEVARPRAIQIDDIYDFNC